MRRVVLALFLLWVVGAVIVNFAVTGVMSLFSPGYLRGSHVISGVATALLLFVLVALVLGSRSWRGVGRPIGDLMDATTRIERGDYSARVTETGPPAVRRAAHAFNRMAEQLADADARRRSVLADVAHELRTPLSVIRGQAEGIADGLYPADAAHLAPILDATRTMEALVEDLRTMVLTDAHALTLNYESVDLQALLNEALQGCAPAAAARGVELRTDYAARLDEVPLDPVRIRSVVANLLSNALRHTAAGGTVTVELSGGADGADVTVRDTGEGVPVALQPHVFERFRKGEGSPGSGLGLAIAKELVEAHGGTIALESSVGKGTAVRVHLPRRGDA